MPTRPTLGWEVLTRMVPRKLEYMVTLILDASRSLLVTCLLPLTWFWNMELGSRGSILCLLATWDGVVPIPGLFLHFLPLHPSVTTQKIGTLAWPLHRWAEGRIQWPFVLYPIVIIRLVFYCILLIIKKKTNHKRWQKWIMSLALRVFCI